MNAIDWLAKSTKNVDEAGIGTARLDSQVLLEDTTGNDQAWLLALSEFELTKTQLYRHEKQIEKLFQAEHELKNTAN